MEKVYTSEEEFDSKRIDDFVLPELEKYIDKRGFIYIAFDDVFPSFIKVGRTSEPKKRLASYNSDKPYKTVKFWYISKPFVDVYMVEEQILGKLYSITEPTTYTKEWFDIKHVDTIKEWILKAEKHFELL